LRSKAAPPLTSKPLNNEENMIQPEIKSILSQDVEYGNEPPDPEDCSVFIEVGIGPKGEEGADIFSFEVVTAKYLMHTVETRWGRGYLITNKFSWPLVESTLNKLLAHCSRQTWQEVATELGKELHWEFESYQEFKPEITR